MINVYALTDKDGRIIRIDGGITDHLVTADYVKIDSGEGKQFEYCQTAYLEKTVITDGGAYRYKLVDGVPVECTAEEIAAQEEALKPVPSTTLESRVETLETTTDDMILLMADLIGGE